MRRVGPVYLEASARVVLAGCHDCPPWRSLRASRADALRAAADHADRTHQDAGLAGYLRDLAARQESRDTRNT